MVTLHKCHAHLVCELAIDPADKATYIRIFQGEGQTDQGRHFKSF